MTPCSASYRQHKPSGQDVVTLNGRDHYLDARKSPERRTAFDRLMAEWLVHGRCLPQAGEITAHRTIVELILEF